MTELARGGVWHWPLGDIHWRFELGDGWDAARVSNVLLVPFAGEKVVVIRTAEGLSPVGGTLEPEEHWCLAASRELAEEAGARLAPEAGDAPTLHPFGLFHCVTKAARPYRPHLPFPESVRVVAWCEVELVGPPTCPPGGEQVLEVLALDVEEACSRLDDSTALVYRLAAQLRSEGVDDAAWTRDTVRLLEEHYLAAPTPEGQSGKHGSAADWELARRIVVAPIDRSGSFLDLGCANGLLMESVVEWSEHSLEPYGLDASERLLALARSRLPDWADRFYTGDAFSWRPPRRFDFVHTMPDLVRARHRPDWLARVRRGFLAPGGRLIVRDCAGTADRLREWGLPVAGSIQQDRGPGRPAVEAAWLEAAPLR